MSPGGSRNEQRRYARVAVSATVDGVLRPPAGPPRPFKAQLAGLSRGGALLRTSEPAVTANAVVELAIKLESALVLRVAGRVRWWRRNGQVRELGVQFDRPSDELGRFVERELAAGAQPEPSA